MKQGRRPTPATGATGPTNLPKRERTGKSPRRPVASVAALSMRGLFPRDPGPEAAAAAILQVGEGQSVAQRQRSLAAFGPAFVSAARLPSTQRRRPQARQHPQRPSRKFSPTSPNNGSRRYVRAKLFHELGLHVPASEAGADVTR